MRRILIVEDDPAIVKGLEASLKEEHYQVLSALDGEAGYQLAKGENIDLIILDVMLPRKNGDEICRDLRAGGIETPIIMLTSRKEELDKVLGLELGADDYV
ncbi:MAG: response regulator, partial [Candidatus Neomarinimicrobiota bacterium]